MIEELLARTALPNLHPAIVHFPIALAAVALLFDGLAWLRPRWRSLAVAGALLWALGAAGAGAAYLSGEEAEESLENLPPGVEEAIGEHEDSALLTLIALGLVAAARVGVEALARGDAQRLRGLRVGALVLGAGAFGLVGRTADLGGALVYRHGVAVEAAAGAGAMGEAVEIDPSRATVLEVNGRAALAVAGAARDARLEAVLDLSELEGTAALALRWAPDRGGVLLRLSPDGRAALVAVENDREQVLDTGRAPAPLRGAHRVAVSARGEHWRAWLDGTLLVHGHTPAAPGDGAAILAEGRGAVRVSDIRIAPLGGEAAPAPERSEAHGHADEHGHAEASEPDHGGDHDAAEHVH